MMRNLCLIFCCVTLLAACQKVVVEQKQVAVIEPKTELVVGTLFGPQIYFSAGQGESGYDYEMASKFAKYLNLELKMKPFANISELYNALRSGKVDILAAGLADTPSRREQFRVGPPLYPGQPSIGISPRYTASKRY